MMDIERNETFLPVLVLREDAEKIALMKAAINACAEECEHILLSLQRRIIAGKKKIDMCTKESNDIELELNALERKIIEAQLSAQESESEAVQTVKDNRNIKRKIISLKNDIEDQEKLLKRANETIEEVKNNAETNKKVKILQNISA